MPRDVNAVGVRSCKGGDSIVPGGGIDMLCISFERPDLPELARRAGAGLSMGEGWEDGKDSSAMSEVADITD
jgi:hypothetical protein